MLLRAQTFGNPVLEPDEQFYRLVGSRMNLGAVPYVDIFDRKPAGLFVFYQQIDWLFGSAAIASQLVMCVLVALTGWMIARVALSQGASRGAAFAAGLAYLIWLNFMQGAGGQAEVIYAPLVMGGAMFTWRADRAAAAHDLRRFLLCGSAAMVLLGLAIQIKCTAVPEGIFFGLWLIYASRHLPLCNLKRIGLAAGFATFALLPTLGIALYFHTLGYFGEFFFANFQSMIGRNPETSENQTDGIIETALILLAPALAALWAFRRHNQAAAHPFWPVWLLVAVLAYLGFGLFVTPHYAIPVLLPLMIAAAPALASKPAMAVLMLVAAINQIVLASNIARKGTAETLQALAAIAHGRPGCIYVHDGYSALYEATGSCLPSRWAFPTHLGFEIENAPTALGVDPTAELHRILRSEPSVIYDRWPADPGANRETRAILDRTLAETYRLAASHQLPGGVTLRAFVRR